MNEHPAVTGALGRAGSSKEYLRSLKKVNHGEIDRIASRYEGKQAGGVYNPEDIAPMVNYGKRGPMPHHVPEGDIKQLLNFKSEDSSIENPETGRVYSPFGISPTLNTMGGGDREPKIVEERMDEGVREFKGTGCGAIREMESGGDKRVVMLNKLRGVLNHEEKVTFKDESNAVDENYWKGMDKHGQRTHVINHQTGVEGGTSIHGILEKADERGKIRVNRDDEKKSEIQGYSTFLPVADYVDLVDNHSKNIIQPIDDYNQNFTDIFGAVRQTNGNKAPRHGVKLKQGARIRKLTPRECWRLQGFPDWAFERAEAVNSDTQLYRQAGNAVTVNVVEAIGRKLMDAWLKSQGEVDPDVER